MEDKIRMAIVNNKNIISFIETIRNSFDGANIVYTHGSCYQFYLILKQVFPTAIAYYNHDHIITKIGHKYYDVTGIVSNIKGYEPFSTYPNKIKKSQSLHKWKFRTS